jgi:nickel/cobalt transporter (NiCoT) family protein
MGFELLGLVAASLALGLRHGLDVDHLAVIDGLTRAHAVGSGGGGVRCGLWFSVGHGSAIVAMTAVISMLGDGVRSPAPWLVQSGGFVAVGALLGLGGANVWSALRGAPGTSHQPITLRGLLARRCAKRVAAHIRGPIAVAGLGALFAASFDAVAAALFFAAAGAGAGITGLGVSLAIAFTAGMVGVDGLTGWCSARLLRRANRESPVAPRVSGMLLGGGCLLTAAALLVEPVVTRGEGFGSACGLALGAGVWSLVPLACAVTWWFSRARTAVSLPPAAGDQR